MKKPKVCLGCFMEWQNEDKACPFCGWEPQKRYGEVFGWIVGDILEQRYLLGMIYCRIADIAVWRMYDTVLGICCFALRVRSDEKDTLYLAAEKLRKAEAFWQSPVVIMAIKEIGEKSTLLFSMEEQEQSADRLQKVLSEKLQTVGDPKSLRMQAEEYSKFSEYRQKDIQNLSGYGQKREQALETGTMLGSRYEVLDCIGIGGFGMVYLCRDLFLHRLTAVKEYFPKEWAEREEQYVSVKKSKLTAAYRFGLKSFYREAQMMAQVMHTPHVVTIYDVMNENDTAYLIMDYIPGISIGREMRIRNYKPYEHREIMEIVAPVLEVLLAFHRQKMIHSDISPGNIMRSKEGEIFLIDLGAAKYTLRTQPVLSAAFLKPGYAAPEQYQTAKEGAPKNEGPWTDMYALGATVYYLLTGQKPPDVMNRLSGKKPDVVFPKKCRLKRKKQWTKFFNHAMALEIRERICSVEQFEEEMRRLSE